MNNELNEKDLERASGGGLLNVLDIDTINALGYTLHRGDEDATNCPSFELSTCEIDLYRYANPYVCSFCVYCVNVMYGSDPWDKYCMKKVTPRN